MAPLTQLKSISRQKDFEEAWNPVHERAFYATKEAIANATLLVHPLPKTQTEIWCDASNIAMGAVLVQFQRGLWKPLSFWSKQLNHAQRGYSATDRELLSVSYAVDTFRAYLEGQPIIVRTDHQPLVGALTKKADTALPVPLAENCTICGPTSLSEGREKRRCRCLVARPLAAERENDGKLYCRCRLCLGRTFYRKKDGPKRCKRRHWSMIHFSARIFRRSNFKHQHAFLVRFHSVLCLTRYHMLTKQILHQFRPL